MSYSDNVIQNESGGDPNATNMASSASGPAGFIDSTWLSMLRQHRPDIAAGKSDADLLALKTDPVLSGQMADAYADDNSQILAKNGLPVTPGTQYLAHFAGPGGAISVLKADPSASAASILGPAAAKANPFLANMSAADLIAWANRKMGTSGAAPQDMASGAPQPAVQGILSGQGRPQGGAGGAGILNTAPDDSAGIGAFQNRLAQLAAQFEQQGAQQVPSLPPIQFAIPRARLLAALSQNRLGG